MLFFMEYDFWNTNDIESIMQDVIDQFLIPRYHALNMKASGEWGQTLEAERTGTHEAVIRGRFYSEFLAKGRGINRDQSPEGLRRWAVWAGKTFIAEWVRDKGITGDPIAIAYGIAKRGTSWKRRGGSNLLEVLTEPETIQFVKERLATIIKPRIAEQLRRSASGAFRN